MSVDPFYKLLGQYDAFREGKIRRAAGPAASETEVQFLLAHAQRNGLRVTLETVERLLAEYRDIRGRSN